MQLIIEKDYEDLSRAAAQQIVDVIKNKPTALLCLAAGDTPRRAYSLIAETAARENTDLSKCSFVSLDEWVGIPPSNEGSCQYFLRHVLFEPLGIRQTRFHLFNALTNDPEAECRKMDNYIKEKEGIDLMVVGIGRNGHIGFNEPGTDPANYSHVVELDETTRSVGQKYFRQTTTLSYGITLGLQHLLESRKAILIANGVHKADIIRRTLEDEISSTVPATIIRKHPNATVIIDREAASVLKQLQD